MLLLLLLPLPPVPTVHPPGLPRGSPVVGTATLLYRGCTLPSNVGVGFGRRRTIPGSVVPVFSRLKRHHTGHEIPTARTTTCVASATSGVTNTLNKIEGTMTIKQVPTKFMGLGPVMHRPSQ